ncbi:MAG: ABC transporter ATP-binding protein/permease [Turicibacter sp.]|nr:ABC transporter ATP-binding protein/permease [Turicibacter sp.]
MKGFQILKRLLGYSKKYTGFLVGGIVSTIIGVGVSLYIPILIGEAIDFILGPNDVNFAGLSRYMIYIAGATVMSAIFQWLMNYCMNQVAFRTVFELRNAAFGKLGAVPLKYIDNHPHGNVINTVINDIEQISDGLLQGFIQLFSGVMTIVGTLVLMLMINWWMTAIVVVLTPLTIFVAGFIAKGIAVKFREQSNLRGELGGLLKEMLTHQKLVRAFAYESRAQEKFEDVNERLRSVGKLAQFYSALTNPCTRFVNSIIYAIVGITGAISVINGAFSIGMLSSLLTFANQYSKPFNEISGVIAEFQAALASAERVFALIDAKEEPADKQLLETFRADGAISFEHLKFSYSARNPLIEDFSLSVQPGQTVAIVGPTGSGKSTLINLLMRFYDVDAGRIIVDGVRHTDLTRQALRSQFGMVLQETWLFKGTIRENIAYGKPGATMGEIIQAAKSAYAHHFVAQLPHGYDTVLAEDGGNLSQGQKQLLAIARVMLVQPPMLILDEATSNIDTLTEVRIQKAFAKMMEGKTSFIVAHRLSTIKSADIILVLDGGQIVEQGTHDELLNAHGFYANLYESQFAVVG